MRTMEYRRCYPFSLSLSGTSCSHTLLSLWPIPSSLLPPQSHLIVGANGRRLNLNHSDSAMSIQFEGHTFTTYEVRVAYALERYITTPDSHPLGNETLNGIMSSVQAGCCSQSKPYGNLTATLKQCHPAILADIVNNQAHWQTEARNVYLRWIELSSQFVQRFDSFRKWVCKANILLLGRLNASGQISEYLLFAGSRTRYG